MNKPAHVFPRLIRSLPRVDLGVPGSHAWLSQSEDHQILFMEFDSDVELRAHRHEAQWGAVVAGRIDLVIDSELSLFQRGDQYFIPAGVTHSAKIYAGYADITVFDSPDRYEV